MSDLVQNFEEILRKQNVKRPATLYSDNKQEYRHDLKPQDVLMSVSKQLKAFQLADSLKNDVAVKKDLQKCSKSNFLSVNKLPVYDEAPKATSKFDTQLVSDTELINVIEHAEMADVNKGITQEFETSFCHTEQNNINKKAGLNISDNDKDLGAVSKKSENNNLGQDFSTENSQYLSVITPNNVKERTDFETQPSDVENNTQDVFSQLLNEYTEIEDDDKAIERPISPIFMHKNVKAKSKAPSPLIFSLDKFEQFEKIAIPILEANDIKTAKQVINSQILNKELDIRLGQDVFLNDREELSSVLQNKYETKQVNIAIDDKNDCKTNIIKEQDSDTDLEFIELDKATSEDLINKYMENKTLKADNDIIKDEILFSSDEEDSLRVIDVEDMPFTCALETSFYDQPDVLDKTMYVAFQTASNKSIQIFTESFAQARNILSDSAVDEVTVTDLVNNCDSLVKTKIPDKPEEIKEQNATKDFVNDCLSKAVIEDYESKTDMPDRQYSNGNNNIDKDNFKGFMTANNKEIKLSEKALARCNKVFQDIDLSENFDKANKSTEDEVIGEVIFEAKDNNKTINEEIQNIDDVIIQEFVNIEMSLEEEKAPDKNIQVIYPDTVDSKDATISDTTESKLKEIFKDVDLDEVLSEASPNKTVNRPLKNIEKESFTRFKTASNKNINISKEAIAQTKKLFQDLDSVKLPTRNSKENKNFEYMEQPSTCKTEFVDLTKASNRTKKIMEKALGDTKNISKDNNLNTEDIHLPDENVNINELNRNNFVGFITASNKNIKISNEALSKTERIFKDIDNTELPIKNIIKNQPKRGSSEDFLDLNKPSTSKATLIGFKTASNREIKISEKAMAKTKNIFKDIDSEDFKFPKKVNKENIIQQNDKITNKEFKRPVASTTFQGFKTANNKEIKITDKTLAKTKNIFEEIDSEHCKFLEKRKCEKAIEENIVIEDNLNNYGLQKPEVPSTSFQGFKTASDRVIKGSKSALAKTKNIFNDINSDVIEIPSKNNKDNVDLCRQHEEVEELTQNYAEMPEFVGFKTANNKKISVSKAALEKTKSIFKDIEDCNIPEKPIQDLAKDDILRDVDDISASKIIDFNHPPASTSTFTGFQTASNKNVTISEESLAKPKNIFKDIDSSTFKFPEKPDKEGKLTKHKNTYPDVDSKCDFIGFKTANNKLINISEKAFEKTRDIFKDIDSFDTETNKKHKTDYPNIEEVFDKEPDTIKESIKTSILKFQGFQTASNKQVLVSEEAIFKSRKLFQDIDESGFNGKKKNIKDTDISNETNNAFDVKDNATPDSYNDNALEQKSSPIFKGFQTANKKPVAISEEALAQTRKIFEDIQNLDNHEPPFYGFKTGNDKRVAVSEDALAKSKKVFEDFYNKDKNSDIEHDKKLITDDCLKKTPKIKANYTDADKITNDINTEGIRHSNIKFSFQTGNKKQIAVSEEAVKSSKCLFSDLDENTDNVNSKEDNITNIIDTQLLNNFEESLHTEDFHETPVKSKRSGSPILSCPKAKKRKKFETPYSQKLPTPVIKTEVMNKNINKINFRENYKKNKKYTLKDLAKLTENKDATIDPYLLRFNFDNLLQFEFNDNRNGLSYNNMTMNFLKEIFVNSVNSKLIPNGWLDNHLKLILWKLISYEIKYKSAIICSARNVIDQLKYRYDKELYNAQRPALRKIFEKDDVASKTMVLCVVQIYEDGVSVVRPLTPNLELLLTDGWYTIKATMDKMLAQLVCDCKIKVGTKLVTNGAELVNCEQGVSPWEDTSAIRLKIFGNSTRRARWDTRLGYHSNAAILTQLSSVKLDGGKVSKLRVFVTRVYPALYVEKFEDGSTVTRSERLEHLYQMKTETERQAIMEKLYEEVEREFSDEESQDSEGLSDASMKRSCLDSGSQIAKLMKKSKDPAEFRAGLTSSQTRLLESHTSKRRECLLEDIQKRIREKIEKSGVCFNRNVVTLLKVRVAGVVEKNGVQVTKGMISIWKPNDAILEIIKEGAWIDVMNVVPTAMRYSEIQISAGRQSVFSTSKYKEPENFKPYTNLLKRTCFTIKVLAQNPAMSTDYNEIDTVGIAFLIEPAISEFDSNKNPFQNVYLADLDKNIICINFWGGLKKFGYQNVLDTGQIVSCANLQKRAGNTRKSIPQFRVTEFSVFTKTPRNENARILVEDLNKKFLSLDRRKFIEDCVVLKNNYSVLKNNCENVSPYRFNISDYNNSKNKIFIDSPLIRPNRIENFNLTDLDFESTFKDTDSQNISEEMIKRKKKVNEKIAKLKMYGEPPPLANIHIINKSKNAANSYKSPLLSKNDNNVQKSYKNNIPLHSKSDSCINVASENNSSEKSGNFNDDEVTSSPLLLNRTYVKTVNPVKINFDVKENNDSTIDHFAEEFDGSPPLSLD